MNRAVVILHNAVSPNASAADADVLEQVQAVHNELQAAGDDITVLPADLNLARVRDLLQHLRPTVVFNLVESLGGQDRWSSLAAELLEGLSLPFTGCPSEALRLSNDKLAQKRRFVSAGLPTPGWCEGDGLLHGTPHLANLLQQKFILKPVSEHASLGMDDGAVLDVVEASQLTELIAARSTETHCRYFAEAYIAGREFNLSLLEENGQVIVLPPAEIVFDDFPPGKPRIVGHAAKWQEDSFEYHHTPRRFDFPAADEPLLEQLAYLARECWRVCGMRGYARVDFRVDEQGRPWVLEVNANPCLSPNAGFAAAIQQSGRTFGDAVEAIVNATSDPVMQANVVRRAAKAERGESPAFKLRTEPTTADGTDIRRIVASTNMFRPAEIDVAVELWEERMAKGAASGYEFVFVEVAGRTVGYACYGRNTMTVSSFDLYWIAVEQEQRGFGWGTKLLHAVEQAIAEQGGTRIYLETSHRPDYFSTRAFYERHGYQLQALLPDYYAPGDDRATFVKALT